MKKYALSLVACLAGLLIAAATVESAVLPASLRWWAIQPLRSLPLPMKSPGSWCRQPVDAFILKKLDAAQLQPSPTADKRTLLRRVTVDLTGLLPTLEEWNAFAADTAPDAYERVVDRLLASPRFGERMARHWLDLVHFAESHGHDEDKHRLHAWPYRDYVIRSFNDDKPYSRFVQEQVAGDALFPETAEGLIALGFLAAGPWDQSSQLGIMDGTLDKQIARYLDRDDMVTTVMQTFTSTTVHCARCHQHKFDPISMDDYYGLQAVFAGVDRIDREFDRDPAIARQRLHLQHEVKRYQQLETIKEIWLTPALQELVDDWEVKEPRWQVLEVEQATSAGGAQLEIHRDGCITSGGQRPDKETVVLQCQMPMSKLTALRLELLPAAHLPKHGPGRHENGNLHLSEIRVAVQDTSGNRVVKIAQARSDYDQPGWEVSKAIDGNTTTAWGIYPQVGTPHVAVFSFSEPITLKPGEKLLITLEQLHGSGHVIGKCRLAGTDADQPNKLKLRSPQVMAALAVDRGHRSDAQQLTLTQCAKLDQLEQQLAALPTAEHVYAVASDFPANGNFKPAVQPRLVEVLRRGEIRSPMRTAVPGALSALTSVPARFVTSVGQPESQRRVALAHWLTHRDNPLPWRSIANRLWQWHFGQGLVSTPNDFGKMGTTPSHPELLDWLACQVRDGVSLKALHRQLVTSATYRQASGATEASREHDPDNRLLSHMPRQRLDAETLRDSLLQAAGKLDCTMYGPSVKHFTEKPGPHVTLVADYDRYALNTPGAYRRSIFRFLFRTVPDPLYDVLDCPDGSQQTARRTESTTPLQALTLLHHPFTVHVSELLAQRIARQATEPIAQLKLVFQLLFQRTPIEREVTLLQPYLIKHGLANTCRLLLNTNEFCYLD